MFERHLLVAVLFFFVVEPCFAPPIELLYRPRPDVFAAMKLVGVSSLSEATEEQKRKINEMVDVNSLGHVAIRLPQGTIPGGRVFGWQPIPTTTLPGGHPMLNHTREKLYYWLIFNDEPGKFRSVPGAFQVDDTWAREGMGNRFDHTRSVPMNVTDEQLNRIVQNIRELNRNPKAEYQLIPNRLGEMNYRYPENHYNCVTALGEIFNGTGITIDEVPGNGSITEFARRAAAKSQPYTERCPFWAVE